MAGEGIEPPTEIEVILPEIHPGDFGHCIKTEHGAQVASPELSRQKWRDLFHLAGSGCIRGMSHRERKDRYRGRS